jgi:hypothetical protein
MLLKPKQNALDVEELDSKLEQALSRMKRKAVEREKKKERKC